MASGYVVAAFLEAAGLIGLVIAVFRMRAEKLAKAAELRGFLRSGQTSLSTLEPAGLRRPTASSARLMAVPFERCSRSAGSTPDSAARSALRRAIVRSGQDLRPAMCAPVSAG